jgi:CubicO group peptidase (beta-lactamase class C family)
MQLMCRRIELFDHYTHQTNSIVRSTFLFFSLFSAALLQAQTNPSTLLQQLGADFPDNTQFSIALVEDGTATYYGYHKKDGEYLPLENQTALFEIGSLTKVFTSTLLAQAVMDKRVKLTQPIKKHLPFALRDRSKITFQQLANHSSGLPRLPDNIYPLLVEHPHNPYKHYDETLLQTYLTKELKAYTPIGEQFAYSNLGAGILGYTLGKVYRQPYQKLLEALVLHPLELKQTYTRVEQAPKERLVQGLDAAGNPTANWDWQVLAPAGCLLSCAEDMSRFAQLQLQADWPAVQLQQQITFKSDDNMSVALGWLVLSKEEGTYYFHNGATGGYTAALLLDQAQQKAVLILSNVSGLHPKRNLVDRLAFELMTQE